MGFGIMYVNVYRSLEHFSTGDFSQRSNVEATARAACEYLNSWISNPKQQVDFQTVSLSAFLMKWSKNTAGNPSNALEDPSQIPTRLDGILAIDAIYNYVVYDYKRQWEALSAEKRNHSKVLLRRAVQFFYESNRSRQDIGLPNDRINYKTITLNSLNNKTSRKKNFK